MTETSDPSPAQAAPIVDVRGSLLSQKAKFRQVMVDGLVFFLKPPTVAERDRLSRVAGLTPTVSRKGKKIRVDEGQIDSTRLAFEALILMAHDSNMQRIFQAADLEALKGMPVGSTVEKLSLECLRVLTPESGATKKNGSE